jgi:hypothetical protein
MGTNHIASRRKTYLASLAIVALAASAQATPMPGSGVAGSGSGHSGTSGAVLDGAVPNATGTPLTHFLPNGSGGFDAFIYPELLNGTPSLQGGIFTLPSMVNSGYVIILDPGGSQNNTATWGDVIQFADDGHGHATTIQMLVAGPNQSSYFPSLNKVQNNPHAFIAETVGADFTDYTVTSGTQVRNYHFFTGTLSVADGGSTLIFLGAAFAAVVVFRRKLQAT